ncbi:MAG: hypothetical protein FOGNACKC_03789 [Anaerolineae bacterium]|nr:hypothetical protein [Anaerolineae bacterium]
MIKNILNSSVMPECSYRASIIGGKRRFPLKACGNDGYIVFNIILTITDLGGFAAPYYLFDSAGIFEV